MAGYHPSMGYILGKVGYNPMVTPSRAITMPDVGYPPKHKNDGYYEISPCLWFKIQPFIDHPDSLGLTSTANFLYAHPS